ncbi:3-oxoadipate enol-lactonase [Aquabacter spiritensis]|uniref:3-oxoadipate enol-lactonase n=1 Tax=Aquabacter spiritensis TaxID=933073 RepID=A0A4R3M5B1_9HYPH|nr:3-oxoadipate enol-lactonase [Aquabacter spiritensis]TCT08212.1 3-oxoadipate enol-lactonase [Aquabacter spiritensis]
MPVLSFSGERFRVALDGPAGAPALVLAHSLGTRLEMWDAVVPALARRFRVVRYDARGHGESVAPDAVYAMGDLGRDLLNILDALSLDLVHLCGLSLGGMVGQWMALNAPQRLGRLVLANTTAHAGPPRLWEARIKHIRRAGTAAVADAVIESWFTPEFRAARPEAVAPIRRMVVQTPAAGYMGTSCAMRDMDFRADLPHIRVPALVIVGARDRATPPAWGDLIAGHIPGARRAVLDCAHMSAIEMPEAFAGLIEDFLISPA